MGGLYRAAVDHHRRALELVVIGAYFVADHVDAAEGTKWYNSDLHTPHFSRALTSLARTGFCQRIDQRTGWLQLVKDHYWHLSDIAHVKGEANSLQQLSGSIFSFSGFPLPSFDPKSLERSVDLFLETCGHVAAALAVANPALLVGMPLSEKYGENPPIGFFEDVQAAELKEMLPDAVREGFAREASQEERTKRIREQMESLPDISIEDVLRQVEEWKDILG